MDAGNVSPKVLFLLACSTLLSATAADRLWPSKFPILGEAPTARMVEAGRSQRQRSLSATRGGYEVDVGRREEVRAFYNTVYVASVGVASGWTGGYEGCEAGTTLPAFRENVLRRIQYFRAMAGVPADIQFDDAYNAKAQEAALIMSAQGGLSHGPPPAWACYTEDGAEAAANSNLALGAQGEESIDGYMNDFGPGNAVVGHRRWLLYPQTAVMGTGDVPGDGNRMEANATWVFDGNFGTPRPPTREPYVAWPPPGYVPYSQVYTRWSFSLPDADFTSATVTLSSNDVPVAVRLEPLGARVGEPTLVWYAVGANTTVPGLMPRPAADIRFSVEIRGVRVGGDSVDFSYTVLAFDPAVPGPDQVLPAITGAVQVPVDVPTAYTFNTVPKADGHEWRQALRETGTLVEGAESNQGGFLDQTSGNYDVVVRSPVASGTSAYHLAHPQPPQTQVLEQGKTFIGGVASEVRFKSRLGWASSNQRASVQLSLDQGKTWAEIWGQAGNNDRGETSFASRSVPLGAYAGRTALIRFAYVYPGSGTYYPQTDDGVGWYFDDIEFLGLDRLGAGTEPSATQGAGFTFDPPSEGMYVLQARALVYGGFPLEWGPAFAVTAAGTAPSTLSWIAPPGISGGRVTLDFRASGGTAPTRYELLRSDGSSWNWTPVPDAVIETLSAPGDFRFTVDAGPGTRAFYRVRGF